METIRTPLARIKVADKGIAEEEEVGVERRVGAEERVGVEEDVAVVITTRNAATVLPKIITRRRRMMVTVKSKIKRRSF